LQNKVAKVVVAVAQLVQLLAYYPKFKGLNTVNPGMMQKLQNKVAKVVGKWYLYSWYND
jgi:hypothetical protein